MMSFFIATILLGVIGSQAVDVIDYQKLFGLDVNLKKDLCMDIVFVLDRSCSVAAEDLVNEYRIIESAINAIEGFGPDKTRIGLVTFDFGARVVFGLDNEETSTREGLLAKLDELKKDTTPPEKCKTYTWEALKLAREDPSLFGGADKSSERARILMLITDGIPFDREGNREEMADKTLAEGASNDADGIKTMAFTVKNKKGVLPPKDLFVELAYSMRWMFQVETELVEDFAAFVFPLLARFTCPYKCDEAIDLIYVMDRSISITTENINKMKEFYKVVTGSFSIGDIRSRTDPKASVAMLSYNRDVYTHFTGLECSDATCVQNKIDQIPNTNADFTVTNLALQAVQGIVNQFTRNGFNGIHPVVVLQTDGNTWKVGAKSIAPAKVSIAVADALRAKGIDTVVVAAPNYREDPGLEELKGIASHFLFDLQSRLTSFEDLIPIAPKLVKLVCDKYKQNSENDV